MLSCIWRAPCDLPRLQTHTHTHTLGWTDGLGLVSACALRFFYTVRSLGEARANSKERRETAAQWKALPLWLAKKCTETRPRCHMQTRRTVRALLLDAHNCSQLTTLLTGRRPEDASTVHNQRHFSFLLVCRYRPTAEAVTVRHIGRVLVCSNEADPSKTNRNRKLMQLVISAIALHSD